jgi:hypothetical protein
MTLISWFEKYRPETSEEWYSSYIGVIEDSKIAKQAIEEFKSAIEDTHCIIYGAGLIGSGLFKVFKRLNISIGFFIDQNAAEIGTVYDIPVYTREKLAEIADNTGYLIFTASSNQTSVAIKREMKKFAPSIRLWDGLAAHIILQSALCMQDLEYGTGMPFKYCFDCSILDNSCNVLKKRLISYNQFEYVKDRKKSTSQRMIGYILGQTCSLNCMHCCESIPYIKPEQKHQVSSEVVLFDITKFASACEFLTIVEFVGGEPLLHHKLLEILNGVLAMKNVGIIHIFTNGTVTPSDELCEVMSHPKIALYISNYTKKLSVVTKERVERTERQLEKYNIHYVWGYGKSWFDFSSFNLTCTNKNELCNKFINCFLHKCNRLYEGRFYQCPHHYGGNILGTIPKDKDVIRIHDFTDEELVLELDRFRERKYIDACKYCTMPFDAPIVQPGMQITKN